MPQKTTAGHNREELQFSPPLKTHFNSLLNIPQLIHTLKTKIMISVGTSERT
jgi:hypothetical protein